MNLSLSLDLGQAPATLAALANPATANRVAAAMAEAYVEAAKDWIGAGSAFTPRTGLLESLIIWRSTAEGAEISSNAQYAGWVEFGTDPHVIRPKPGRKALKIPDGSNGYALRGAVHHPGSKAYPYFFADQANREAGLLDAAMGVLAEAMDHG